MANDPDAILGERVRAVQQWLTAHGGCVDESDPDAQRELVTGFILPLLAEAWNEGWWARDEFSDDPITEPRNPYEPRDLRAMFDNMTHAEFEQYPDTREKREYIISLYREDWKRAGLL